MKGFTLVETLVAITIVLVAVTAPLFTAGRSTVVAEMSAYQMTASFLAQEGLEFVRMMRDNEYLASYVNPPANGNTVSQDAWTHFVRGGGADPWTIQFCTVKSGANADNPSNKPCALDPNQASLATCGTTTCSDAPLFRLSAPGAGGIYTPDGSLGGERTPFYRSIKATHISDTEEMIVSTVRWTLHGSTYAVTSTELLTQWQ